MADDAEGRMPAFLQQWSPRKLRAKELIDVFACIL
jgi:hypothetical protein